MSTGTNFLSIIDKSKLYSLAQNGNKEGIELLINEIDRLESIIKDYEIGINQLLHKYNDKIIKNPKIPK